MTIYTGALGRRIARQGYEGRRLTEVSAEWNLNEWETGFVESIANTLGRGYYPSQKQNAILNRIVEANGSTWDQIVNEARAVQSIDEANHHIHRINARGYGTTARHEEAIAQANEVLGR